MRGRSELQRYLVYCWFDGDTLRSSDWSGGQLDVPTSTQYCRRHVSIEVACLLTVFLQLAAAECCRRRRHGILFIGSALAKAAAHIKRDNWKCANQQPHRVKSRASRNSVQCRAHCCRRLHLWNKERRRSTTTNIQADNRHRPTESSTSSTACKPKGTQRRIFASNKIAFNRKRTTHECVYLVTFVWHLDDLDTWTLPGYFEDVPALRTKKLEHERHSHKQTKPNTLSAAFLLQNPADNVNSVKIAHD